MIRDFVRHDVSAYDDITVTYKVGHAPVMVVYNDPDPPETIDLTMITTQPLLEELLRRHGFQSKHQEL